jgi:hypothetical protein
LIKLRSNIEIKAKIKRSYQWGSAILKVKGTRKSFDPLPKVTGQALVSAYTIKIGSYKYCG